jgi:hypothetical protein
LAFSGETGEEGGRREMGENREGEGLGKAKVAEGRKRERERKKERSQVFLPSDIISNYHPKALFPDSITPGVCVSVQAFLR